MIVDCSWSPLVTEAGIFALILKQASFSVISSSWWNSSAAVMVERLTGAVAALQQEDVDPLTEDENRRLVQLNPCAEKTLARVVATGTTGSTFRIRVVRTLIPKVDLVLGEGHQAIIPT
jgi:hypothetical protein